MTDLDAMRFVADYEGGRLTQGEIITGFQALLDDDRMWGQPDALVAQVEFMIDSGVVHT